MDAWSHTPPATVTVIFIIRTHCESENVQLPLRSLSWETNAFYYFLLNHLTKWTRYKKSIYEATQRCFLVAIDYDEMSFDLIIHIPAAGSSHDLASNY